MYESLGDNDCNLEHVPLQRECLVSCELVHVPTVIARCPKCRTIMRTDNRQIIEQLGAGGSISGPCQCGVTLRVHRQRIVSAR